jgi:hypothetical protein
MSYFYTEDDKKNLKAAFILGKEKLVREVHPLHIHSNNIRRYFCLSCYGLDLLLYKRRD